MVAEASEMQCQVVAICEKKDKEFDASSSVML